MIHNLIAATVLGLIAAAAWYMTSPATSARRAARAAYAAGADLPTGWASAQTSAPDWLADLPCRDAAPCRDGRAHCRECRQGGDCRDTDPGERPAYAAGRSVLTAPGRHEVAQVVARWLAGAWWDSPLPVDLRLQLARMAGAVRPPVQLGFPIGRLP